MTNVFVNLPTTDLERAKAFYIALGCEINPQFTDDNGACVVWGDNVFFMVITREFFVDVHRQADRRPNASLQVSVAFSRDSREEVDAIVAKGLAAGGTSPSPRRTTASCTCATWTTRTATRSASCTWSPRPLRSARRRTWPSGHRFRVMRDRI